MPENRYFTSSGGVGVLAAAPSLYGGHGDRTPTHEQQSRTCLASLDPRLNVIAANEEFFQQFGRSPADVCGRSLYQLLDPTTRITLEHQFVRLAEGHHPRFVERIVGLDGAEETFSGELTGMAVWEEAERLSAIVVTVHADRARTDVGDADESPSVQRGSGRRATRRKSGLTQLDARILEGVAAGASTVQLASRLYLSRQGVEYHVGSMLRRLRVSNRAALVSRAYSIGLLTAGNWPPRVAPDAFS